MSIAMTRFKTLIHREWLQHRLGWMGVMLLPLAIALLLLPFSSSVEMGDMKLEALGGNLHPSTIAFMAIWGFSTMGVVGLTLLAQLFQVSGLARRDAQDRSLEFWMSLPGSHSEHLSATVLSHTLLVLLLAVGVGLASGLVIALGGVAKIFGMAGLGTVQWAQAVELLVPGLVRLVVGLPLFVLWLLPLVLLLMAAPAWLKRWGVPVVVISSVLLSNLPATRGPVREWLMGYVAGLDGAFFPDNPAQLQAAGVQISSLSFDNVSSFWRAMGQDLTYQLGQLATLMFLSVAVLGALCFVALVYRRKHHL